MDADILKFILSNKGSVDTEELLYNLWDSSLVSEIICEDDRFVSCSLNLRPAVVVRTGLRLCCRKDCPKCDSLHLCVHLLLSGACTFHPRGGCSFSHELHSEYNMEVLSKFGLEALSRTELCLLLLQSNNMLLPKICRTYNSDVDCKDDCQWLHVCERHLNCDSDCPRTHDFFAPQPLSILRKKKIPDNIIKVLKSVYANKEALRLAEKGNRRDNSETQAGTSSDINSELDISKTSTKQTSGRGKRGGRGRRGKVPIGGCKGQKRQDRAASSCKTQDHADHNDDTENDDNQDQNATEENCSDDCDSDSSSTIGTGNSNDYQGTKAKGRGGNRGHNRNRRGRGSRQAASNFDGCVNEKEASRRGNFNFRGNSRGGRGNRGHRGGTSGRAEAVSYRSDLQEEDKGDVNSSQQPIPSTSNFQPPHWASPVKSADGSGVGPQRRQRDKMEICMFFIKGHCIHEDRCFKAHEKVPYKWEIKQGGKWTPMPENEMIEKDFCDPENTYSTTSPPVHFDTMKCKSDEVRRLSTLNSVLEPDFIHTTDWLWYWEDEYENWYEYAALTSEHSMASITSKELEEMYVKNNRDVVRFMAGQQSYELSFQDMIQTNINYNTKKLVRRRPRFVSAAQVQTKKKRPPHSTAVPDYWDKTQIPQTGYKRVALQPSSKEYQDIQMLFSQTMAAFHTLKIERIQNKAVWETFQLHKTHMKHKNGGRPVLEKQLFHGTERRFVHTICVTNFDWRVCGVNGTVYGQGSYFARDAKYSHDYTGDSDPRCMFVSRVLVGEFTEGSPEYRRPPSKDGGDVNLFDSCVNDIYDPSIFVVFKEQQIYPEYLLQYKHSGRSNVYAQSSRQSTYPLYRTVPPPNTYAPSPSSSLWQSPATPNTPAAPTPDDQSSCIIA